MIDKTENKELLIIKELNGIADFESILINDMVIQFLKSKGFDSIDELIENHQLSGEKLNKAAFMILLCICRGSNNNINDEKKELTNATQRQNKHRAVTG